MALDPSLFTEDSNLVPGPEKRGASESPRHLMVLRSNLSSCSLKSPALSVLKVKSPIEKKDSKRLSPIRTQKSLKIASCLSGAVTQFSDSFLSRAKKQNKSSPVSKSSGAKKKQAKCDVYGWEGEY